MEYIGLFNWRLTGYIEEETDLGKSDLANGWAHLRALFDPCWIPLWADKSGRWRSDRQFSFYRCCMALFRGASAICNGAEQSTFCLFFGKFNLLHPLYCIDHYSFPICMGFARVHPEPKRYAAKVAFDGKRHIF